MLIGGGSVCVNSEGRTEVCASRPSCARPGFSWSEVCPQARVCEEPWLQPGVASRVYSPFLLAAEFHDDHIGAASQRDRPLPQTFNPNPWVQTFEDIFLLIGVLALFFQNMFLWIF